jgi:Leucine-rich repeat (LRR) protein
LKRFPKLKHLNLYGRNVDDAGLAHLSTLHELEELALGATHVGNNGLATLKQLKKLKYLYLRHTSVTDAGLIHLRGMVNLQGLDLFAIGITSKGMQDIGTLTNLKFLNLSLTQVDDIGLRDLKNLLQLGDVSLEGCKNVNESGLIELHVLKSLRELNIKGTKITPTGFEQLKKALPKCRIQSDHGTYEPTVTPATAMSDREVAEWVLSRKGRIGIKDELSEFVDIKKLPKREMTILNINLGKSYGDGKLVDADLAKLAGLKLIRYLSLAGAKNITDDGLRHLSGLTSLTWLDVSECPNITGKGIPYLAKLTKLKNLGLSVPSDNDLTPILGLKNLSQLFLSQSKITPAGLAKIHEAFDGLTLLHLEHVPLEDAAVAEIVRMKNLTSLKITDTKISPAGFEQLKKALPRCWIESNHGKQVPTLK